jgi:hypothetical protein
MITAGEVPELRPTGRMDGMIRCSTNFRQGGRSAVAGRASACDGTTTGREEGEMTMIQMSRRGCCMLGLGAALTLPFGAAQAQPLEKLDIVVFSAPSLGAFMPPIIKARKLDRTNGLDITWHERTPDAYTAQFNSGEV